MIPEIPEVSDEDVTFGGADQHLPIYRELPEEFRRMHSPFCDAASGLFFNGGKLSDYDLRVKEGIDRRRAIRLLQALLGSYGRPHEHKIGGVGFLLSQWCEIVEAESRS